VDIRKAENVRMQFTEITTFGIFLHCITNDFEKENTGENFKENNFKEVEKKWNASTRHHYFVIFVFLG
jgi:hypothetical protein